jgi:hypothetical protein
MLSLKLFWVHNVYESIQVKLWTRYVFNHKKHHLLAFARTLYISIKYILKYKNT